MAMELNSEGDFSAVVDGWEPVTLQRRESADTVAVARALRFSSSIEEADAAGGHVARHDVVWQFAWDGANDLPRLGDSIIDAAGDCWTILSVERRGGATRLRCQTRNLRMVYGLVDRVDVQQAVWDDPGTGPEIVGWTAVRPALAARIQPYRVTVDEESTPVSSTATYHVTLAEQIELDHNHRLVDPQGTVYQVIEYAQAERIDVLPVAIVVKQAAGA
jgi:hypothetical protein